MTERLCARPGSDPSWWDQEASADHAAFARQVCGRCPSAVQCRADAVQYGISGICGGISFLHGQRSRQAPQSRPVRSRPVFAPDQDVLAQLAFAAASERWADTAAVHAMRQAVIA